MSDEHPETLEEAARVEQRALWHDLPDAMANGIGTEWSIRCEGIAWRITNLARFVGATSWEEVSVRLLRAGVYERVLDEAGISYEPIDWDRVTRTEASIDERMARLPNR